MSDTHRANPRLAWVLGAALTDVQTVMLFVAAHLRKPYGREGGLSPRPGDPRLSAVILDEAAGERLPLDDEVVIAVDHTDDFLEPGAG